MQRVTETAIKAARQAGIHMKERLGKVRDIDYKGAFNIVTDVDKRCERIILDVLSAEFPDFDVLAEEGGAKGSGATRRWIIDPLDGTTNYTHSYPFFSTSIALEECGKVVMGVVYNPIADELFWAEEGLGAWLNEKQMKVSRVDALAESLLATGFPNDTLHAGDDNMLRFVTITDLSHGVRRDGSAALDLCFVAAGRLDGFWETKLSPWDIAAGSLIVKEAGGMVSNLYGESLDLSAGYILSTNGSIHDELVALIKDLDGKKLHSSARQSTL